MDISFKKYNLIYKNPIGTSRGILHEKVSYVVQVIDEGQTGIGECSLLPGLSPDNMSTYADQIIDIESNPNYYVVDNADNDLLSLEQFPSLRFGLEMALRDLETPELHHYFDTSFTKGHQSIAMNGLIWMGDKDFMYNQLRNKLNDGWTCIKIKIGQHDFDEELKMLAYIRSQFSSAEVSLRLDANGAFDYASAAEKLKDLSTFDIHSIEQPIAAHLWDHMADLCQQKIVDIALDEDLIGVYGAQRKSLIQTIKPTYIILKPSLLGGWRACDQWIALANESGVSWWATSALESNIGLNAIAQWTSTYNPKHPQGLGTGGLYINNLDSPLTTSPGYLHYHPAKNWGNINTIN